MNGPSMASSIFAVPSPVVGQIAAPNAPGNFGIGGPGVPFASWAPRGTGRGYVTPMDAFLGGGQPPVSHGHITLKGFDFIQHQYMLPPTRDRANQRLMRGMLTFAVREMDTDDDATLIYSVASLNQLAKDQWNDFVRETSPDSPYLDPEKQRFLKYMQKYGDNALCAFAKARRSGIGLAAYQTEKNAAAAAELMEFMQLAEQDGLCYLTKYGFLNKVNWHGVVINTNMAEMLEHLDDTESGDHYVQANLNLAKRAEVANVFGPSDQITAGSLLWVTLTRKHCGEGNRFGTFVLTPGGSNVHTRPRNIDYVDESGTQCNGHHWLVGTVIEPCERSPQMGQLQVVNNTVPANGVNDSYQMYGTLPMMRVSVGFSQ